MVSLQDPTGAQLSLWQPRQHIGAQLMREHGALTWTELMTRDLETAERFYSGLFGWTADKESYAQMKYTVFMQGGQGVAGMMAITEDMGPIPPNWLVYFHVDSCDEAVEQAQAGGGALAAPVMDIADVGRIAIIRDPTGAVFGVMEPSRTGT
jgi:predicted enzyme related to lactoylglutathione lyase